MTPDEARSILGLKPEDDPHQHFADFADARERIAEMVRKAPNETLALRYQEGLIEFDRALAAIREDLDLREKAALTPPEGGADLTNATEIPAVSIVAGATAGAVAEFLPGHSEAAPVAQPPPLPTVSSETTTAVVPEPQPSLEPVASAAELPGSATPPPLPAVVSSSEEPAPAQDSEPLVVESSIGPVAATPEATPPPLFSESAPDFEVIPPAQLVPPVIPEPASSFAASGEFQIPADPAPAIPIAEPLFSVSPPPLPEPVAPVAAIEVTPAAPEPAPVAEPLFGFTPPPLRGPATPVEASAGTEVVPAEPAAEPLFGFTASATPSEPVTLAAVAEEVPVSPEVAPVSPVAGPLFGSAPPPLPEPVTPATTAGEPPAAPVSAGPLFGSTSPVTPQLTPQPEPFSEQLTGAAPQSAEPSLPAEPAPAAFTPLFPPATPAVPAPSEPAAGLPATPPTADSAKEEPLVSPYSPAPGVPFKIPAPLFASSPPPSKAEAADTVASSSPEKPAEPPAAAPVIAETEAQPNLSANLPREPEPGESAPEAEPAVPAGSRLSDPGDYPAPRRSSGFLKGAFVVLLLLGGIGGGIAYYIHQQRELERSEQLIYLESLGGKMVEARQWPEALEAYRKIEALGGSPDIVQRGRRSVEAGMDDEQTQFVGYWSGEALAAFEAGRSEDAEDAARKVLERYPDEKETADLLAKIEQAKITKIIEDLKKAAREGIQRRQWDAAEASAKDLVARFPEDSEGYSILKEIREDREREIRNKTRAGNLFAAAKLKDQGRFDREAMEWLREASSLDPENKEIAALYQKIASYTRTVHVPGDFPDLNKALQSCGDRDRIVLGEGTWPGGLVIGKGVSLEGAGSDKTIIEIDATQSAAATFGPAAKGARISGITFRQTSFDSGASRFPALLVRGADVTATDCRFAEASGHGVAVIDAGVFTAKRCTFDGNGWDGVAASGPGSRLALEECESNNNVGHGYDAWNGASAAIRGCHAGLNSRNGILLDTTAKDVVLENNELRGNREYGLVVAAAAGGKVASNLCRENLLGGLVMRTAAAALTVENNRAEKNTGPGLVLEQGLPPSKYTSNAATANAAGKDTLANVDFSSAQ